MSHAGRIAAVLLTLIVATGCTRVTGGTVRAAAHLTPNAVLGDTVKQALLDETELRALGQPFDSGPNIPPRFGDEAFDRRSDVSDPQCALVVGALQQGSYDSAQVRGAAREIWWGPTGDRDATVIDVVEAVVALPTATDADALFEEFTQRWQRCAQTKVSTSLSTYTLARPTVADSVASARWTSRDDHFNLPGERAVGVRVNCLVEVEVVYYPNLHGDQHQGVAVDLAHRIMDKVTGLS